MRMDMIDFLLYIIGFFNIISCIIFIYYCILYIIDIKKDYSDDSDKDLIVELLKRNAEIQKKYETIKKQITAFNRDDNNIHN